jgi:diacylglycerol kinase family enzyme
MDVIEKGSTDAVVLVGGSGLVVEAVTGFLRREDSEDVAANIPIGIIPTGKHTTLLRALLR